jgi:hypothetical protein
MSAGAAKPTDAHAPPDGRSLMDSNK